MVIDMPLVALPKWVVKNFPKYPKSSRLRALAWSFAVLNFSYKLHRWMIITVLEGCSLRSMLGSVSSPVCASLARLYYRS